MGRDGKKTLFHRGGLACVIEQTEHGIWWGYIGLHSEHPHFGSRFVRIGPARLFKVAAPSDNQHLVELWWLGFEGGYSEQTTLDYLKTAADGLAANHAA